MTAVRNAGVIIIAAAGNEKYLTLSYRLLRWRGIRECDRLQRKQIYPISVHRGGCGCPGETPVQTKSGWLRRRSSQHSGGRFPGYQKVHPQLLSRHFYGIPPHVAGYGSDEPRPRYDPQNWTAGLRHHHHRCRHRRTGQHFGGIIDAFKAVQAAQDLVSGAAPAFRSGHRIPSSLSLGSSNSMTLPTGQ